MKTSALGVLATVSIYAIAGQAAAMQQQPSAPQNPGPAIAGVCVYHNERLLGQSAAGRALQQGMERLANDVRTELQPYATSIQSEYQSLQQGAQTIPQAELQQRAQALQQRAQEAEQLEQTREIELRYTMQMQRMAIAERVDPIIIQVYQERGCGILIDRESVYLMNPAMDITDVVIQRLDQQLPTLNFQRMTPPVQQQQ